MAEGAGLPFAKLLVPNCAEEFTCRRRAGEPRPRAPAAGVAAAGDFCTAVAVAAGGRHVVGHNMDWYVVDVDKNVLFDLTDAGRHARHGHRRRALPADARHELARRRQREQLGVLATTTAPGVPNVFVRRWDARGADARGGARRAACSRRGRAAPTTSSPTATGASGTWRPRRRRSALIDRTAAGFVAHTNHYVAPAMAAVRGLAATRSRACGSPTAERMLARGPRRRRRPGRARGARAALPRARAGAAICGHPDETRAAGRAGHDRRQHDLRPRRAPHPRLRRAALREPVPDLRDVARGRRPREPTSTSSSPTAASSTAAATPGTTATSACAATASPPSARRARCAAARVVDAADRYVTPGFVDPHTHSDVSILQHPRADSAVRQGVTTHVTGNCGMSPAPLERRAPRRRRCTTGGTTGTSPASPGSWRTFAPVPRGRCSAPAHAINIAPLVGHGALRLAVMGFAERAGHASASCARMERLLDAAHARRRSRHVERARLPAGLLRRHRGARRACAGVVARYQRHLHLARARRARDDPRGGRRGHRHRPRAAACRVEVSHNAPKWGAPEDAGANLALIEQARREGLDVTTDNDVHTELAPRLSRALPQPVLDLGHDELMALLARPRAPRRRLRRDIAEDALPGAGYTGLVRHGRFDRIVDPARRAATRSCAAAPWPPSPPSAARDAFDTFLDLIVEEDDRDRRHLRLHRRGRHPGAAAQPAGDGVARTGSSCRRPDDARRSRRCTGPAATASTRASSSATCATSRCCASRRRSAR